METTCFSSLTHVRFSQASVILAHGKQGLKTFLLGNILAKQHEGKAEEAGYHVILYSILLGNMLV